MFLFKTAAGVTTLLGLAAVAVVALYYITRNPKAKVPVILACVVGIILVVAVPTWRSIQMDRTKAETDAVRARDRAIYRVRVTVLDPHNVPVDGARVWSSMGGEAKKIDGGWEFDIPSAAKPANGQLIVYATIASAFWNGKNDVQLADDYNPNTTVKLKTEGNAHIRGIVTDDKGQAITGARVSVAGYGSEAITTQPDGNFILPAHAAEGQQTQLHAEKKGYKAANQWHPAGESPATVVLDRK